MKRVDFIEIRVKGRDKLSSVVIELENSKRMVTASIFDCQDKDLIMRFLAFSDVHLHNTEELRKILSVLKKEKEEVDAFIFGGDIASLRGESLVNEEKIIKKFLSEVEKFDLPFYFVWGNRDLILFHHLKRLEPSMLNKIENIIENSHILRLINGKKLEICKRTFITDDPHRTDKRTILLTHFPPLVMVEGKTVESFRKIQEIKKRTFLYFAGHTHYGQIWDNYFNLGFAHRDDFHGSRDLWGFYWIFEVEDLSVRKFEIKFIEKNTRIRRFVCEKHKQYGEWIIHWRKCPLCYLERDLGTPLEV